jgi:hypothetical protein
VAVIDLATDVTWTHNILAHAKARAPQVTEGSAFEFVNNVVYNYSNSGTEIMTSAQVDAMGNVYIAGPNTQSNVEITITGVQTPRLYVKNNIGPNRPTDTGDEWLVVNGGAGSAYYQSLMQLLARPTRPATQFVVGRVESHVLANAGARVPSLDAVDDQIISDIRGRTGNIKDCVEQNVTIYWPIGPVISGTLTSVTFAAPVGGVNPGRYNGLPIEVDYGGDGEWDEQQTIGTTTVSGSTVTVTTGSWTGGAPSSSDDFRIHNPCTSNYTVGYPSPIQGTPQPDEDSDGLPDAFELYLTNGASPTSAAPTDDHDLDGYDNTEEWMHSFYVGLRPTLIRMN